jgi:hypothetical protein
LKAGAGGHPQLLLHEVQTGDHFGNRVLDLQAGVHLDEEELAVFIKKLDRACAG